MPTRGTGAGIDERNFPLTAHRNGIPKPKSNRYASMKGVDPKASPGAPCLDTTLPG